MRLLAVDDDELILELVEVFLGTIGYDDVEYVTSGAEALRAINEAKTPFDCILLDIQMPGMTGIQLIPLVRAIDAYAFTPIIMLTAMVDRNWIAQAFAAGAWDYVAKPFELFELESRLHAAELRIAETERFFARPENAPAQLEIAAKKQIALPCAQEGEEVTKRGLVLEDAFENCVQRIISQAGSDLRIFAIELDRFNSKLCDLNAETQASYPAEMALQLRGVLAPQQAIVTYRGNGRFLALSYAVDNMDITRLDKLVKKAARKTDKRIFKPGSPKTAFRTGQARGSDVPHGTDPLHIIHVAEESLQEA